VSDPPAAEEQYEVVCPHCHKPFQAPLIDGAAARYRGFKCPHCKLFVPFTRAAEPEAEPEVANPTE
jgi:DNA-directed RNA polymerase subunit RPC12/RpoP